MAITAGEAIFLGESVGVRRWLAVLIGFFGIILIVKPALADFDPLSLLAVVAVICLSARDLATRAMKTTLQTLTISIYGFGAMAAAGILAIPFYGDFIWLNFGEIIILMVGIASGVAAYYLILGATRYGDASLVAPFRYSRLIFALLLSILILGERPDLLTWLGAFIVVFSGYFIVLRERNIKNVKN